MRKTVSKNIYLFARKMVVNVVVKCRLRHWAEFASAVALLHDLHLVVIAGLSKVCKTKIFR